MKRRSLIVVALALITLTGKVSYADTTAATPRYTITDLSLLPGGLPENYGTGINNKG